MGGGGGGGGLKIYLHLHKQSAGKSFIARAITVCLRLKPVLETIHEWMNELMLNGYPAQMKKTGNYETNKVI